VNGTPGPAIIVIGYGNLLRGDDGVGPRVAEVVSAWGLPTVRVLIVQQLTPELAEPLAAADLAIFVDAVVARPGGTTQVLPLEPGGVGTTIGHTGDPTSLLSLARIAFGRHPRAWSITIPATNVATSEGLSPAAERGMEDALWHIALLVSREGGEERCTSRPSGPLAS
jgi:hydrogenase maturation protease